MTCHAVLKTWPLGLSHDKNRGRRNLGLRPRFLSTESLGPCVSCGPRIRKTVHTGAGGRAPLLERESIAVIILALNMLKPIFTHILELFRLHVFCWHIY